MEGSDKGFSSSNILRSPLVPKSSHSGSGENNENDTSQDQMISKLHNPKKPVAKHFMSPTISAASKVAVPRKKILAERNENSSFSDTQIQKTPDLQMKNSPGNSSIGHSDLSSSRFISSKSFALVTNDNDFAADASLKPYDPLTNYLSPRPKYLRYDPNRRHKIFHCKVSESREGKDGTGIKTSVSFDFQKGVGVEEHCLTQENEENPAKVDNNTYDDEEEEDEEEEEEEIEEFEERGCSLRGVLKFLLILFVCFLSKTHLCSMNSPTPSPIQQISEAAYMEVYGGGFLEVEERDSGLEVHNIHMVEDDNLDMVDSSEAEMIKEDKLDMEDKNTEHVESDRDYEVGKNSELDNVQMAEVDNVERVESIEAEMVEDDTLDSNTESVECDCDSEVFKTGEVSEEVPLTLAAERVESIEAEMVDNVERVESIEAEMVEDDKLDSNTESVEYDCDSEECGEEEYMTEGFEKYTVAKTAQSDDAGGCELVKEVEGSDQTPLKTEGVKPDVERLESHEMPVNLVNEIDEEFDYDGETERVGSNILVVAVVSTFSIILASLIFVCRSRKGKTTSVEDSQPTLNPFKSTVEDKVTLVCPALEEEHIEKTMTPGFPAKEEEHIIKEIESSTRPLSLSSSIEEAPKEIRSYIHAPTIELLGEIVIREVGSSHRKNPVIESEECSASQKWSKSRPVSVPSQPFFAQEISTKDSPSYIKTDEMKILKKEGSKDGEPKIELTTPVRRSSRIRNRSIMSP